MPLIVGHPAWLSAYVRGGRAAVLKRIVSDSITEVREAPGPRDLDHLGDRKLATAIGKIGAPQEILYQLARLMKPEVVVETGVYWGISTAFILAALHDNRRGHLYSVDLPGGTQAPLKPDEPTGFVVPDELRGRWTLRLGPVREQLPLLKKDISKVDLFYHDADHRYSEMTWEMELFLGWSHDGSILIVDDVDANSAFHDFLRSHSEMVNPRGSLGARLGMLTRVGSSQ